ncbi:MAG TPA: hypothetical protein VFW87_11885, partial [Pirellulales bacterium]|nr:hypothetical protein [Pirellulales bacterium]
MIDSPALFLVEEPGHADRQGRSHRIEPIERILRKVIAQPGGLRAFDGVVVAEEQILDGIDFRVDFDERFLFCGIKLLA